MKIDKFEAIYCHGVPGSAAEIEGLIPEGCISPSVLEPLDLAGFDAAVLDNMQKPLHLIGFSLGAMTALRIAASRPTDVGKVTLIAPAAPLELGDFLPYMAGQAVFNIASKGEVAFNLFTKFQRLGVVFAPRQIIKTMFSGSPQADLNLLSNMAFEKTLISGLKSSLGDNQKSYREAVRAYVQPWGHFLEDIKCSVTIHHGKEDNWAPIEMAYALQEAINSQVDVIAYENLGHYSTLQKALPIVL